jgi:hypothetical protein
MYTPPKTTTYVPSTTTGSQTFNIDWKERNGSLDTISEFAGKKTPYHGTVSIPEGNLKTITFNLTWTDDRMTFFKRMGLDTLTLEVSTPDGQTLIESNRSAPITGNGRIEFSIAVNFNPPMTVEADNLEAAQAKLKQGPYYDDSWIDKPINYNVSVQIGELRILKKLRDKGNDFDLSVTYQYLIGTIKEGKTIQTGYDTENPPPEDPWASQTIPPYMSMIINTGCGRFV